MVNGILVGGVDQWVRMTCANRQTDARANRYFSLLKSRQRSKKSVKASPIIPAPTLIRAKSSDATAVNPSSHATLNLGVGSGRFGKNMDLSSLPHATCREQQKVNLNRVS